MPALSWSPASEGPITRIVVLFLSNVIGSAPYFRLVARLLALDSVKLPVICERAVGDHALEVRRGDDLAVEHDREGPGWSPAIACDSLRCTSAPWLLSWMSTVHCTWPCWLPGAPADAEEISVPSIRAGDSRYLLLWASQVTSGRVGSSTTGGTAGQRERVVDGHRLRVGVLLPRQAVLERRPVRRGVVHLGGRGRHLRPARRRLRRGRRSGSRSARRSPASSCSCRAGPEDGSCRTATGSPGASPVTSTRSGSPAASRPLRETRSDAGTAGLVALVGHLGHEAEPELRLARPRSAPGRSWWRPASGPRSRCCPGW